MYQTTGDIQDIAESNNYRILATIISSLSLLGCAIIISTYFLFRDLQTTPRKILVYISIGDFFTVFPTLVLTWKYYSIKTKYTHSDDCIAQSFVTTTAIMWSFLWTSSLAIYLYIYLVKKKPEGAEKSMLIFHIINWGVPLILVGAAYGNHMLGSAQGHNSGGWCWIKSKKNTPPDWKTILWMLGCGKLCEVTSYFVNGICYFIVSRKIKADVREYFVSGESKQAAMQGQKKLVLAPLLFVFLRIWGTIRFILFCFGESPSDGIGHFLLICHIIGDSAQGFVNFLLFCVFTKKFRDNFYKFCNFKRHMNGNMNSEDNSMLTRSGESISEHKYLFKQPGPITFYT